MKIACAAPAEMEYYIEELTEQLLYDLLPQYVSDERLQHIHNHYLLGHHDESNPLYNGLLDEALQVISSLQTVIALVESIQHRPIEKSDRDRFSKNVRILSKFGFIFPLSIELFERENLLVSYSQTSSQTEYYH